jgi:hypothetical protein
VRSVLAPIPLLSQVAAIEAAPQSDCGAVHVVDTAGRPVPDARVTWWGRNAAIQQPTVGFWGLTDEHGGQSGNDLRSKGFVEVEAAARQGGRCAGVTVRRWKWRRQPPVRIVLKPNPVPRGDVSGLECGLLVRSHAAGTFQVRVTLERDEQLNRRVLETVVVFQQNERRRADIHWPAGGTIAGRVVAKDGAPIAGVSIRATPAGHSPLYDGSEIGVETTSDSGGHFAFRHLAPSVPWRVDFSSNDHGWTDTKLTVGTTEAVVTMPPRP